MTLYRVNRILESTVGRLLEKTSQVDGDVWELDGKKGVWREVSGSPVFFPTDGSAPVGLPKAAQSADAKDLIDNPGERKKRFKEAAGGLKRAVSGSGGDAVSALEDEGTEEDRETVKKMDKGEGVGRSEIKAFAANALKKMMILGLGAALLSAFPAILGYAMIFMVAQAATKKIMSSLFEEKIKLSRAGFSKALEDSVKSVIDDLAKGDVDEKLFAQAIKIGERKASKTRGSGKKNVA